MTRRILAPLLLMIAAIASCAAVFAVHDIEGQGGPLAQPFVSSAISPGRPRDDGGLAVIRFTTQQPEQVTARVIDAGGQVRATVLDNVPVEGSRIEPWDGTDDAGDPLPDGAYRVQITRRGDDRIYAPTNQIMVDTRAPIAKLDALSLVDGELRGLVLMDPSDDIAVADGDGNRIDDELRAVRPAPGTPTLTPRPSWPAGTVLVRFRVPLRDVKLLDDLQITIVDRAHNRTEILDDAARRAIQRPS